MSMRSQILYLLGLSNSTQPKPLKGRFLSISTTCHLQSLSTVSSKELRREHGKLTCSEATRTLQKLDRYIVNMHSHGSKEALAADRFLNKYSVGNQGAQSTMPLACLFIFNSMADSKSQQGRRGVTPRHCGACISTAHETLY